MKWLVLQPCQGGIAEIYNVGIFEASSPEEAKELARVAFYTTAKLEVVSIDQVSHWSYYTLR